jgi:hypothetical protein
MMCVRVVCLLLRGEKGGEGCKQSVVQLATRQPRWMMS